MAWRKKQKYVLLSQSRSGTRLMNWLMGSHPEVCAEGELLSRDQELIRHRSVLEFARFYPDPLLYRRAATAPEPVYGFTLMFYHPHFQRTTLQRLARRGWQVIHLKRENVLNIAWSYLIAEKTGTWHARSGDPPADYTVHISKQELSAELNKRVYWHRRQNELASRVPHIALSYESDLADRTRWQPACDRVFRRLGIPSHPVSAPLRKTDRRPRHEVVENYDQLLLWLNASRFRYLRTNNDRTCRASETRNG